VRLRSLDGGCNACDETAASCSDDDDVDRLHVLDELEADGARTGDDERIFEGMDEHAAGLFLKLAQTLERLGRVRGLEVDRRAVATRRVDLELVRAPPHDQQRIDACRRSAERDRLRVVAGRDRDHAPRALLVCQRRKLREHAARLERAGALEELGLEENARARELRELRRVDKRRAHEPVADPFARAQHIVERHDLGRHAAMLAACSLMT
jgi:hypothetical protein